MKDSFVEQFLQLEKKVNEAMNKFEKNLKMCYETQPKDKPFDDLTTEGKIEVIKLTINELNSNKTDKNRVKTEDEIRRLSNMAKLFNSYLNLNK